MAYDITMLTIKSKTSDLKVCNCCKRINWYSNEKCVSSEDGGECECSEFDESQEAVEKAIEEEHDFYTEEEGYSEDEFDGIYYLV